MKPGRARCALERPLEAGAGTELEAGHPVTGRGAFGVLWLVPSWKRDRKTGPSADRRRPQLLQRGWCGRAGGSAQRSCGHVQSGRCMSVQQGRPWRVTPDLSGRVMGMRREREMGYWPEHGRPPPRAEGPGRPQPGPLSPQFFRLTSASVSQRLQDEAQPSACEDSQDWLSTHSLTFKKLTLADLIRQGTAVL